MKNMKAIVRLGTLTAVAIAIAGCMSDKTLPKDTANSMALTQENRINAILANMTLEQKIGQMIQGEIKHVSPEDVRQYGLGSILNGGGSFPFNNKHASPAQWLELADAYFEASIDQSGGNAGIPISWGTDAVHGHNNVVGATLFPHNIGLGAANNPALVGAIGKATAVEVAATGIDWIFAPTVAVVKDDRWGRTYEGYSDQAELVASYAGEIVHGIQDQGIVATAKHFIGDGGTLRGVDQGDTRLTLDALLEQHGRGYQTAIDAGVMTVMASFNSWNGDKIHGNKTLLTDVLKNQLGFDGFVVSDWNGIGQVPGCTNDSCPQAINAGIDMVMVPDDWRALHNNMVREVETGLIPIARIDDAVRRILRVKLRSGLLDAVKPSLRVANSSALIGSEAHRLLARQAVRQSLVLLKNNSGLLPLHPHQQVLVAGSGANDIGQQNGGWTITWQGTGNSNDDFPQGTSIFQGISDVVVEAGGKAILSESGQFQNKPDVAVVVFGEKPYAEGLGDVPSLAWQQGYKTDLKLLQSLQQAKIPVVAVLLTGRPMWVNAELNASDAFVVAWLPGSEGAGVADVLFSDSDGKARYDFRGRLSFDWPAIDLNADNHDAPINQQLFPLGYGLDYSSKQQLANNLNETPVGKVENVDKVVFHRSSKAPWGMLIADAQNPPQMVEAGRAELASGKLSVIAVDFKVQEDARQLTWKSQIGNFNKVFWQSDSPVDFTELRDMDGALSLKMRVDEAATSKVILQMDCGLPCTAAIDITSIVNSFSIGEWVQIAVPMACLESAGAALSKIDSPLVLSADGHFKMTLSEAAVITNVPAEALLICPS